MSVDAEYYRELLRGVFRGRRFLIIGGPVVGQAALGRELRALGAERPFLLGLGPGTGALPAADEAEWRALDVRAGDMIASTWSYEARLGALPDGIRDAIERWDPERRGRVLGYIVLSEVTEVAGRQRYAPRPRAWAALEDKTRVHAFLDSIGVRRGPLVVVRAETACLAAAHARLDRGEGTVWAGDARPGIHGGAVFVRWVRSPASAREADQLFAKHCERVRVMPFVEGIPCSIHGVVFPDAVAAFRPVEMLTLRRPTSGRLVYAGGATYWDPDAADREGMRALARRVGEGLRERVGYRGAFTLDGVLGEDGFVPTELNPRVGAGLMNLCERVPELPLRPLALAAQHGEALDYRPRSLERLVLEAADRYRSGGGRLVIPARRESTLGCPLVAAAPGYRVAQNGEPADGALMVGPSNVGGFVAFRPRPESVEIGASIAPRVIQAFAVADAEFGTGIGALEPPRAVR